MANLFEKRHYNTLAKYWNEQREYYKDNKPDSAVVGEMYRRFLVVCKSGNPQFSRESFDEASGFTS